MLKGKVSSIHHLILHLHSIVLQVPPGETVRSEYLAHFSILVTRLSTYSITFMELADTFLLALLANPELFTGEILRTLEKITTPAMWYTLSTTQ